MLAALRYLTGDAEGGGACARQLLEQPLLLQVTRDFNVFNVLAHVPVTSVSLLFCVIALIMQPPHLTHCTHLPQHLGAQLTSRDPSACAAAAHVLANILRHIPAAAATICDTPDIASLLLLHLKIDAAATPAALAVATSSLHLLAALALTPDGYAPPRPQASQTSFPAHPRHLCCCTRAGNDARSPTDTLPVQVSPWLPPLPAPSSPNTTVCRLQLPQRLSFIAPLLRVWLP